MFTNMVVPVVTAAFVVLATEYIIPLQMISYYRSVKVEGAFGLKFRRKVVGDKYLIPRAALVAMLLTVGMFYCGEKSLLAVLLTCILIAVYMGVTVWAKVVERKS
jgi:hypothetical protein